MGPRTAVETQRLSEFGKRHSIDFKTDSIAFGKRPVPYGLFDRPSPISLKDTAIFRLLTTNSGV